MTDTRKIRLGFVNGDHLHFGDLLTQALACPTAHTSALSIARSPLSIDRSPLSIEH